MHYKVYTLWPNVFIPGIWEWVNRQKLINVICHLNRKKEENPKPAFSLSSLTFVKTFSFSSLSAIRVMICIFEVVDISASNLDSSLWFIQPGISHDVHCILGFPGGASGKEPTCQWRRQGTQVWSLGQEDTLEAGLATYCSILVWRTHAQRAPLHKVAKSQTQLKQLSRSMHSAFKLNKQGENIQLWCTPFPILNQSVVPCPVLTIASWPPYRFLRKKVRWSGIPIILRIFQSFLWSIQSKALA